jgi:hypothetical protein
VEYAQIAIYSIAPSVKSAAISLNCSSASLQIFHYFQGNHGGCREIIAIGQALILEPEDVQAGLVARHQLVIAVGTPAAIGFLW